MTVWDQDTQTPLNDISKLPSLSLYFDAMEGKREGSGATASPAEGRRKRGSYGGVKREKEKEKSLNPHLGKKEEEGTKERGKKGIVGTHDLDGGLSRSVEKGKTWAPGSLSDTSEID